MNTKTEKIVPSIYARVFDENLPAWSPEPMYNMIFLRAHENYANDLLSSRGHVLLNDIYDMLHIDRTKEGCIIGWIRNKNTHINFGFDEDFAKNNESSVLLDFNVDGVIYDKI